MSQQPTNQEPTEPRPAESTGVDPADAGSFADSGVSGEPMPGRRNVLSSVVMTGGLVAGYGALAAMGARFLYPRDRESLWMFVTETDSLGVGDSMVYRTPQGASVVIVRNDKGEDANSFLALSNVCPHLGCKVNWEPLKSRFFCPCHNGAFDPSGKAIAGPPAQAGQRLEAFSLKVDQGLLYIEVAPLVACREEVESGADLRSDRAIAERGAEPGAFGGDSQEGHDGCLREGRDRWV